MFPHKPLFPTLLSLLLLAVLPALAVEYTGRVVGISDGDTLTLLTPEKQQIKVRLAAIPFNGLAKQTASDQDKFAKT